MPHGFGRDAEMIACTPTMAVQQNSNAKHHSVDGPSGQRDKNIGDQQYYLPRRAVLILRLR
jgi:hypothetical protein